mgnify:CR=1 FL=1
MKAEDFVRLIRNSVIDENHAIYKDLFDSTDRGAVSDEYWVRALSLYDQLDEKSQAVVFEIIRQVMSDTVSNLFGVLDGVNWPDGQAEGYNLQTESGKGGKINGDLQDLFLEMEEE